MRKLVYLLPFLSVFVIIYFDSQLSPIEFLPPATLLIKKIFHVMIWLWTIEFWFSWRSDRSIWAKTRILIFLILAIKTSFLLSWLAISYEEDWMSRTSSPAKNKIYSLAFRDCKLTILDELEGYRHQSPPLEPFCSSLSQNPPSTHWSKDGQELVIGEEPSHYLYNVRTRQGTYPYGKQQEKLDAAKRQAEAREYYMRFFATPVDQIRDLGGHCSCWQLCHCEHTFYYQGKIFLKDQDAYEKAPCTTYKFTPVFSEDPLWKDIEKMKCYSNDSKTLMIHPPTGKHFFQRDFD